MVKLILRLTKLPSFRWLFMLVDLVEFWLFLEEERWFFSLLDFVNLG